MKSLWITKYQICRHEFSKMKGILIDKLNAKSYVEILHWLWIFNLLPSHSLTFCFWKFLEVGGYNPVELLRHCHMAQSFKLMLVLAITLFCCFCYCFCYYYCSCCWVLILACHGQTTHWPSALCLLLEVGGYNSVELLRHCDKAQTFKFMILPAIAFVIACCCFCYYYCFCCWFLLLAFHFYCLLSNICHWDK